MYGKREVTCRACGARQMQDLRDPNDLGCCGGSMEPTGVEEYDQEFVDDERHATKARREYEDYGRRGYYD